MIPTKMVDYPRGFAAEILQMLDRFPPDTLKGVGTCRVTDIVTLQQFPVNLCLFSNVTVLTLSHTSIQCINTLTLEQ